MNSMFIEFLGAGNVPKALVWATEKLSAFAASIKIPDMVLFALGALIALLVGVIGYKCVKLFSAACFGVGGFAAGYALFSVVNTKFELDAPKFVGVIIGLVLLAVLGYLAYKKFAYALFGVIGFAIFVFAYFVYPNYLLAVAAGILAALISTYCVRLAVIVITSFFGGFTVVAMVSAMVPWVKVFNFNQGIISKLIALGVFVIFAIVQFATTHSKKKAEGPKRVKIRRVFDAW